MFGATDIFNEAGEIVSTDFKKVGQMISESEKKAQNHSNEAKLIRIEIGLAIRAVAGANGATLTETIDSMSLCETLQLAEKTFLKMARVAGSSSLLQLGTNNGISYSVLDECAASKKPDDPPKRKEFMKRLCGELEGMVSHDDNTEAYHGPSRSEAIGCIRRLQIEFEVPVRGMDGGGVGEGERGGGRKRKELTLINKLIRLNNCFRFIFVLPRVEKDEWLAKTGMNLAEIGGTMHSLMDELIDEGLIVTDVATVSPDHISPGWTAKNPHDIEEDPDAPEEGEDDGGGEV
jgi:hypothetical protein|tara:strand:- start:10917 stop:11786 length:870 start_codon:yes stop_codon:yes gene_type:complete